MCFHALRELLVQSEANNNYYSTAVAPTKNHDFMLWLKCVVGHPKQAFVPLPGHGSAFAFLVDPAALELHEESWVWTGSGGLQLLGSIGKLAESHIG